MTGSPVALDTNVLSELMQPEPAASLVHFVADLDTPLVSAAVFHELAYGVARLPDGQRKVRMIAEIDEFHRRYRQRIIVVGYEVARISGKLRAQTPKAWGEI